MSAKKNSRKQRKKQNSVENKAGFSAVAARVVAASDPSLAPKSTESSLQRIRKELDKMPSVSGLDYAQFYKVAVMPDVAAGLEAYQVFDGYKQLLPDSSVRLPPTQDVVPVQRSGKGNYEVVWAQADALYNPKKNYERQVFIQPGKERVMEYTMKQDGFEPSISIRLKTGKQLRIDGKMMRVAMRGPEELVQMLEYVLTETQDDIEQAGNQGIKQELQQQKNLAKNLQQQLQAAAEEIKRMQSGPAVYATVLKLKEKDKRVSIVMAGKKCEVQMPENLKLRLGGSVLISPENMAIFGVDDDDVISGEIATLKTVTGLTGEIERAGTARAIALCGPAEPGDRVVVDDTGSIALSILGPPKNTSVFGESTGVRWEDIGGLVEAKRHMRDAIEGPFKNADKFAKFGKKPTRGVLLFGPPGCGKTMLGKAAATALADLHGAKSQGGFYYVKGPELLDMYVGNTEANIRKMFEDARLHQKKNGFPAVIFLDEADAILGKRGERGVGMNTTVVPQFLSEMDGLEESGAIVLIATNRPETLDPAIVRDGRIDRRILVSRPTQLDVVSIAEKALAKKPLGFGTAQNLAACLARDVFDEKLAIAKVSRRGKDGTVNLTLGHTVNGAMVVGVVERATALAMHKDADFLEEGHISGAVIQAYNEALDVNHDDDIMDLCAGFTGDVTRIERGERIAA